MRNAFLFVAVAITVSLTGEAIASCDDARRDSPKETWLDKAAIKSKLTDLGYSVRKIEIEESCYEVKATDKEGKNVELYVDPVTGKVEKSSQR